jgi:hypothetical protein
VAEYEECPFCDRVFAVESVRRKVVGPARILRSNLRITGTAAYLRTPLERHIEEVHHKVKVRKGLRYMWLDVAEIEAQLGSRGRSKA